MKAITVLVLFAALPLLLGLLMLLNLRSKKHFADENQEIAVVHCVSIAIASVLIGIGIGVLVLTAVALWLL